MPAGVCFIDSSALLKRYVAERGSAWINELILSPQVDPYIAQITAVEMVAAMARRLTGRQAASAIGAFRADYAQGYSVINITAALVEQAMTLAERRKLRGYDAVQLAAALAIQARLPSQTTLILIASDAELLDAARAEGLEVDDPNDHP
ncbi:MAG: type II toxin-antitoxin system VapC family toxin [Chloroflexi bacterium]|nr:type II toxin-antitoxin system VapC family toxin [Chloroflexota bacterium]MCL5273193.1 type II toxin-antitoxin system VapC family toxin [Chloroflexota bacterium]